MGMDSVFRLSVVMGMQDNLTAPLSGVSDSVTDTTKKLDDAFGAVQKAGAALAGVGAGVTTACIATVTSTFDTQDALGELSSLGVTDLKAVEAAAKSFSDTWAGTTKSDFISASYDIKSGIASLTDEGVAQFTELAALTGKATKSTTEEMGSLFATGYGIYKGAYEDMSDLEFGEMFSAGISTAVKNYKTAGSEMASSISALGATATNNKVPLEEQLAILGQLQTTMSGSEAATKYKSFLNQAASAGKKLGLSFVDANNQLLSTPEILEKLKGKYGDTIDAVEKQKIKEAFGTDEAVAMIDLLYTDINGLSDGIESMAGSMKKGSAVTTEMAEAINNTPAQKFQVIKQQIHNNVEELGNGLLPVVNETMDKVSGLIKKGSEWIGNNQKTVQTIMNIVLKLGVVLMVLGTVIGVIGTVGKVVLAAKNAIAAVKGAWMLLSGAFVASPVGWVVLGIMALVAAFVLLWKKSEAFRNFWIGLFDKVKGVAINAWSTLNTVFQNLGRKFIGLYEAVVLLWKKSEAFRNFWIALFEKVKAAVINAWSTLQPALQNLGQKLMGLYEAVKPILKILGIIAGVTITYFLSTFVGAIHGVLAALTPLTNALSSLVSFVTNIINAIVALFRGDFGGACDFLLSAVDNVKDFFINGFDAILSFINGFVDGFLNVVGGALAAVGIDVSGTISKIKNTVSSGLNAIKGFFGNILGAATSTVKSNLSNIKNAFQKNGGGIKGVTAAALAGIKGFFTSGLRFIDNLTGGKLTAIKNKFSNGLHGALNVVGSVLGGIKNKFRSMLDGAKNIVHGAIEKIKGFFNFSWELPKIKLPHFGITGEFSLNPPSIPKLSVDWYADGGVMTSPTIFGAAGGKLLGGGEAGDEAILPLSVLWEKLKVFIHNEMNQDKDKNQGSVGSVISELTRKETRTLESKEKVTERDIQEIKSGNSKGNTIIQKLEIKVDIEKIKDLPMLYKLIDEIKDAQNSTDEPVTA